MPSLAFVAASVPLTATDIREHRLPNRFTYPLAITALLGTLVATALSGEWFRFGVALGVNLLISLALFPLVLKEAFGMGDLKLMLSGNQLLGYLSPPSLLLGICLAFTLGSLYGIAKRLVSKGSFKDSIPFGPFLLVGYLAGLVPELLRF